MDCEYIFVDFCVKEYTSRDQSEFCFHLHLFIHIKFLVVLVLPSFLEETEWLLTGIWIHTELYL